MQLSRRAATQADIPFLLALRRETMDAHFAASGMHITDDVHRARLMQHFDCAEVLVGDGASVGLLKLLRSPEKWEIVQLQLAGELQGRGIGRALLQELLADAARAQVAVELSVLKINPARLLYERLGFKLVGEDEYEYRMRHEA